MHLHSHDRTPRKFTAGIDPRLKLLGALALLVMVLSSGGFAFPLTTAALCLLLCLGTGVPPLSIARRFAEPLFIVAMIVLLKLFADGHSVLFSFSFFGLELAACREGLAQGLLIAARIVGAVSVVTALSFSIQFTELLAALAWLHVPRGFIEIAHFAWRYLFILFDDAKAIYGAQKNRLGYAGYRQGLRSFGTLSGSLVIKAFDNSANVTTAMVQRGYDGTLPMLRHQPFKTAELLGSVIVVGIFGVLWHTI